MYGHPHAGPGTSVWEFVAGRSQQPMAELGWKSVGVLELTAFGTAVVMNYRYTDDFAGDRPGE